jgi:integrase
MAIDRRPDRRKPWRARYWGPDGRQHSRSFERKAEAQRWLAEVEHDRSRGAWTKPALGRVRFSVWVGEWQETTNNVRPTTAVRDRMLLDRYLLPRFGSTPLANISQRDVRAWVTELSGKGLAPATVHKCYQILSKILAAAVEGGMIPRSPCRQIPLPKIERAEMRFLTVAEVRRLATAVGPGYRALILLGAYGGLRIGEMAGLRRKRLDLAAGVVEVAEVVTEMHGHLYLGRPKTTAGRRRVGLPKAVLEALQEHLASRSVEPDGFVFALSNGAPLRTANFRARVWRPATRAAGLEGCASMTYGMRRSRCGSPLGQVRKRSRPGRDTLGELHLGPLRASVPGSGPGVAGPSGPLPRGGRRCRVGHDVDQMWTRDTESAAGSKTATL